MHNDSIQLRTSEEEEGDLMEDDEDEEEEGINMLHINVKNSGSGLKTGQNALLEGMFENKQGGGGGGG
eukprot:gene15658-20005_t